MSEKIIQLRGIFNYQKYNKFWKHYVCFYILTQFYAFSVEYVIAYLGHVYF